MFNFFKKIYSYIKEHPKKIYFVLFILISLGVYSNIWDNGFTMDDGIYIQKNPLIRDIKNIPRLILSPYCVVEGNLGNYLYRPLASIGYALIYALDGLNWTVFHLSNVLFHGINAFLVFLFSSLFLKKRYLALVTALIFLVHPVETDTVASAVGLSGILMTFFSLLSLLFYIKLNNGRKSYFLSLIFYFLAMLSKEFGVFLIVFIGLYDLMERAEFNTKTYFKKRFVYNLGFFSVFLIYFGLRFYVVRALFIPYENMVYNPLIGKSTFARILTGIHILVFHYVRLMVFPKKMCALYAYDQIDIIKSPFDLTFLISIVVIILFGILAYYLKKKNHKGYLGILLFISFVFFFSNIPFLSGAVVAERFLYLPSIGFIIFIVSVYQLIRHKINRYITSGLLLAILVAGSVRTYNRLDDWKNNFAMFKSIVREYPENAWAQYHLGLSYYYVRDFKKAINHFDETLDIYSEAKDVYSFIGAAHANLDNHKMALHYYEKSLKDKEPTSELWKNIGYSYRRLNQFRNSEKAYRNALKVDPKNHIARYQLSRLYYEEGKSDEALAASKALLEFYPDESFVYNNVADIYWKKGEEGRANEYWKKAIEKEEYLQHYDTRKTFHFDLAVIFASWGDSKSAIIEYEELIEYGYNNVEIWINLGNAYLTNKNLDKAIESYENALALTPENKFVHFQIAKTYYRAGEYENARDEYLYLIDFYPELTFLNRRLAMIEDKLRKESLIQNEF